MKTLLARLTAIAAFSFAFASNASAATITVGFNNINGQCVYSESGFNFACSGNHTDGSQDLYFHNYGANPGLNDIDVTFNGGMFSAIAFDITSLNDALMIVDNFGRSMQFNAAGSYDLSSFSNVSWLKLSTDVIGGAGVILDNFKFDNAPSSVPEPGSLALMGLALAGMLFARRRTS